MRVLAELFGIVIFLIGAYYGGIAIWDHWHHGKVLTPAEHDRDVAVKASIEANRQANEVRREIIEKGN